MFLTIKRLNLIEKNLCQKTISPKAIYAIIGDAVLRKTSISVVRMGDGEYKILKADNTKPFDAFEKKYIGWNKKLGIESMPTDILQKSIIKAGNTCTYFAPSLSGISLPNYNLYNFFKSRQYYFDNFYVNDWTAVMIKMLLETSGGIFILHREYKKIIHNFNKTYKFNNGIEVKFDGFPKNGWEDNEQAVDAAIKSGMQLILYSGGPGAKIIGPEIAKTKNKIVLDVGNALVPWSIKGKEIK